MPCALVGSRHGTPTLPGPTRPPHSPPFQEALHPGPSVFLWGSWSLVSRHLTMKTFSPAQLSTPPLGEASTPQPEAGLVPPKHGSAPCTCLPQPLHKGAELGFWKGAGREGQLVTDLSTAELGDAFQDRAVHPTVSAQMAQLRPTEGRARYRATRQRIIIAIIVLACI